MTRFFDKLGSLKNKKPAIRFKNEEMVKRDGSPTEIWADNRN